MTTIVISLLIVGTAYGLSVALVLLGTRWLIRQRSKMLSTRGRTFIGLRCEHGLPYFRCDKCSKEPSNRLPELGKKRDTKENTHEVEA